MLNLRTAGLRIISQKSPNIYLIEENCFPATMFTRPESAGGCTITKTTSGHLAVFRFLFTSKNSALDPTVRTFAELVTVAPGLGG